MINLFAILTMLSILHCTAQSTSVDQVCRAGSNVKGRNINLSIQSQRNQSGQWVTKFMTSKDSEDSTSIVKLDLHHTFVECDGKKFIQIHGILIDTPAVLSCSELFFHTHFSKNIEISQNRKTAHRKKPESEGYFASTLTHRPLNREELFEVRIDKNISKYGDNIVMGVTSHTPSSIEFPSWMGFMNNDTWVMIGDQIWSASSTLKSNYGKSLRKLQAGDRVGVSVKSDNTLHFYINGIDQGAAANNIPNSVYGIAEIQGNTIQVTILDKCS